MTAPKKLLVLIAMLILFVTASESKGTAPKTWWTRCGTVRVLFSSRSELPTALQKPRVVSKDLVTPKMTEEPPAAGKRVWQIAPEYKGTKVYHALYLPTDWKPGGKYPVIVEYTGNYWPPCKSTGQVKDANLGYGMSGGRQFIWVSMPYIAKGRKKNTVTWWGDREATIEYCKVNLPRICRQFGGDPENVFLCGFSRGAIAASYIGLADDKIASLWKGIFTHDHFDGHKKWGYAKSDRASALKRLARLKGRPVLICGTHASKVREEFLKDHLHLASFQFLDVPTTRIFKIPEGPYVHPHTDLWMHRASKYRQQARTWLQNVLQEASATDQEQQSSDECGKSSARSPRQVAEQLATIYGKQLNRVNYISALPLVAKLRLSEATGERKYATEVHRIVAPFLRGNKNPRPKSGSAMAGHLIFAELARRAKGKDRQRWIQLCRVAADQIFRKDGKPLSVMPYHNQMSDAVFMAGPILAATGKLTGERKYFDAAALHFATMRKYCLRRDGLYRHSPLCEAAWGRGNGFPALGLALSLSDWPDDHPAKKALIAEFQKHMAALRRHQDNKTGCWHQVIDHPKSYNEYSCTCMIGFAMHRGIRRGWLSKDFQVSVDKAWRAIQERTSSDGKLVNVCAGTGKQRTLRAYFKRPAINGRDPRGGAMGLLFTTELLATK